MYQRGYALPMPRFDQEPGLEPVCIECAFIPGRWVKLVLDACRPRDTTPAPRNEPNKPQDQINKELRDKFADAEDPARELDPFKRNQERLDALNDAFKDQGYSADQIFDMMRGMQGGFWP
jgi:hypothetical protein